jgi:hypothetical protein
MLRHPPAQLPDPAAATPEPAGAAEAAPEALEDALAAAPELPEAALAGALAALERAGAAEEAVAFGATFEALEEEQAASPMPAATRKNRLTPGTLPAEPPAGQFFGACHTP